MAAGGAQYGSVNLTIGGGGATGGDSGQLVKVTSVGDIGTTGMQSNGILAQSLGGGGGNGGFAVSAGGAQIRCRVAGLRRQRG